MDWGYILSNTLLYGLIAFVFTSVFAYGKYMNFMVGAVIVYVGYCLQSLIVHGFSRGILAGLVAMFLGYTLVNRCALHYFPHEKQRDLFGLIFSFGGSIIVENIINATFGPNAVGLSDVHLGVGHLVIIFVVCNLLIWYIFGRAYLGILMKGIQEKTLVVRSLGIPVQQMVMVFFSLLFLLMMAIALLLLAESNMRAGDAMFYMIKAIGIMILVGIGSKQYILRGALCYVLLEYLMFIKLGWSIAYKETLILVLILLVLLLRPQGLFTSASRTV